MNTINIVFYNVNKNKNIDETLDSLVKEKNVDILVLAEYVNEIDTLCEKLSKDSNRLYYPSQSFLGCDKIKVIKVSSIKDEILQEESRYIILRVSTLFSDIIFGMIHAESKLNSEDSDRLATYGAFVNDLLNVEQKFNTKNTIILGDFNSNPFEQNIINANGIHAIPYKEELKKIERTVSGRIYEKFYNPMWRFLGSSQPPYGTYHYNTSKISNYYWNIFDQVIIRPQVMSAFEDKSLEIISKISNFNLLKNAYKPDVTYSDHLPIFFRIREEKLK